MLLNLRLAPAFVLVPCFLGVAGLGIGCSSGKREPKLVPVVGKVTADGEPLRMGTVVFQPDVATGNLTQREATGEIDAQGNYELFTEKQPGAAPGRYKVVVVSAEPFSRDNPKKRRERFIDPRYNSVETSGLAFEVKEQHEPGAFDLRLSKPSAAQKMIPGSRR